VLMTQRFFDLFLLALDVAIVLHLNLNLL